MTTLTDRPSSALLVVDMQEGVLAPTHGRDAVVENVAALVDQARTGGVPVVWVQHNDDQGLEQGSALWELVAALVPAALEPVVQKWFADAFEDTRLEEVLADSRVGRLLVCGAQTDECIRGTLHGALVRGYDVFLVSDAHTTEDLSGYGAPTPDLVVAHTNLFWSGHRAPGRSAGVLTTAEACAGELAGAGADRVS